MVVEVRQSFSSEKRAKADERQSFCVCVCVCVCVWVVCVCVFSKVPYTVTRYHK